MKGISLAVGVVLLALLTAVAVGNHSAAGVDKPPVVGWKAVPYLTAPINTVGGNGFFTLANLSFTVPEAGFVWLNSTGSCNFVSGSSILPGIAIGWFNMANALPGPLGNAVFNNVPTITFVGENLPYSASAVFPVSGGTETFFLNLSVAGGSIVSSVQCSGVNVVMFTNTQLP